MDATLMVNELLIVLLVLAIIAIGAFIILAWWVVHEARDPYSSISTLYDTFELNENFTAKTAAGFKVQYRLSLNCQRINVEEFKKATMADPDAQKGLAEQFNGDYFEQFFEEHRCFFHLHLHAAEAFPFGRIYEVFRTPVCQITRKNGEAYVAEIPDTTVTNAVRPKVLLSSGCQVELGDFYHNIFPPELVKENYAMLTKEEKEAVLRDEHYGRYEQMLAIAALKRQLDFFGDETSHEYQAETFTIKAEKAGCSVKLSWRMSPESRGYFLLGFRAEGGFASDRWSEKENGLLIVDSTKDGEMTQTLQDGTSYYYTFFLKNFDEAPPDHPIRDFFWTPGFIYKRSVLRFQIAIASRQETDAIQNALVRFEERARPDPLKENLSKALKEVGAYVEMDTAFEAMEKSFAEAIRKSDRQEDIKQRKIERLGEFIAEIRSKYEP